MDIDFAFICDYAEIGPKISALGIGFDTIHAAAVPTKHPVFFLVIQFRTSVVEVGQKDLEINLIDEDGNSIMPPMQKQVSIPRPAAGTESIGRIAVGFHNVEFPRYGSYSLHATIDKVQVVRVSLKVSPPPSTT